jgi:hypothetical protein
MTPLYRVYLKSMSLVLLCQLWIDLSVGPSLLHFLSNSSLISHIIWYDIIVTHCCMYIHYSLCPTKTVKAAVISVNWMMALWTGCKNIKAYKRTRSFHTFSSWFLISYWLWLEFTADTDTDICYLYLVQYTRFKRLSQI